MMEQNKHGTIEQIKVVWDNWASDHLSAEDAMLDIGDIVQNAADRERRLKSISDAARKERANRAVTK